MAEHRHPQRKITDCLTCSICMEPYDLDHHEPKVLPCQHSFCIKCMQDMVDRNFDSSTLPCPICRKCVNCPVAAEALPKNLALVDIMEILAKSNDEPSDKNKPDTSSANEKSKVASVRTRKDAGTTCQGLNSLQCSQHGVEATNVCRQCQVYLCPKCFCGAGISVGDAAPLPPHFWHAIEEVDSALEKMTQELQKKHDDMKVYLQKKRAEVERDIRKTTKLCAEMEAKIHEKYMAMIRQAEEWEKRMKTQIQDVKTKHHEVAESKLLMLKYEEALCTSLWRNGQEKIAAQDLHALKVIQVFDEIKKPSSAKLKIRSPTKPHK